MSSSTLFRIAGGILLIMPIGHVRMAYDTINPGLQSLGDSNGAFSSKTAWASLNGYFIATGLMCLNWADRGLQPGWDGYILGTLVVTQLLAGSAYVYKRIPSPAAVYLSAGGLMGVAAIRELL